jgi:hypothetical protein
VSEGKKPLRVLRRISGLILYKLCVKRIRCTIKLTGLARTRPIVSSYALNQSTNKAGSTLPELSLRNFHVRSQAIVVHGKYNVRFTRIETHFLRISCKSIEYLMRSLWGGKNASCGDYERSSVRLYLIKYQLLNRLSYIHNVHYTNCLQNVGERQRILWNSPRGNLSLLKGVEEFQPVLPYEQTDFGEIRHRMSQCNAVKHVWLSQKSVQWQP